MLWIQCNTNNLCIQSFFLTEDGIHGKYNFLFYKYFLVSTKNNNITNIQQYHKYIYNYLEDKVLK